MILCFWLSAFTRGFLLCRCPCGAQAIHCLMRLSHSHSFRCYSLSLSQSLDWRLRRLAPLFGRALLRSLMNHLPPGKAGKGKGDEHLHKAAMQCVCSLSLSLCPFFALCDSLLFCVSLRLGFLLCVCPCVLLCVLFGVFVCLYPVPCSLSACVGGVI